MSRCSSSASRDKGLTRRMMAHWRSLCLSLLIQVPMITALNKPDVDPRDDNMPLMPVVLYPRPAAMANLARNYN